MFLEFTLIEASYRQRFLSEAIVFRDSQLRDLKEEGKVLEGLKTVIQLFLAVIYQLYDLIALLFDYSTDEISEVFVKFGA